MSTQSQTESSVIRFFDNFLQEKNIKWVLATGMLILLGSSLMVVMPHWDVFQPMWKFLTIVAYTGVMFAAGWWSYHRLSLRKTGTALLALTVLMVPVSFVAWHWLWVSENSALGRVIALSLLVLNGVTAIFTSRRTFSHFLRGSQPTFAASYLLLSFAGAIAPSFRDAGPFVSWLASIVLWGVFSIGVVKVNRHVFWLTEEHRSPRILGFFPILLLGGQFLILFAMNFARSWSIEWLGFGSVLVAIPVLLTADTIAKVFQERTGNLVRPIPWPIMLPFVVGIILCLSGVGVAATEMIERAPHALVPTAALAAFLMAMTARRTQHSAFVWVMLAGIVVAYNFSPVFYQSLARSVISQGAAAVKESRLPYAFYGLTYLPLIVSVAGAAAFAERRGNRLFAIPLRRFCISISMLLLVCSVGHVKATLPVAAVMTIVFTGLGSLFQDRRLILAAIVAFLIATVGAVPFVETVFAVAAAPTLRFAMPLGGTFLLLLASPLLDQAINRIPLPVTHQRNVVDLVWSSLARSMSLLATCALALAWLFQIGLPHSTSHSFFGVLVVGALLVHSLVWLRSSVSWCTYGFAAAELVRSAIALRTPFESFTTIIVFLLMGQWILSYGLAQRPHSRITRAWGNVNHYSAWAGLCLVMVVVAIPTMVLQSVGNSSSLLVLTRDLFLAVWCLDAARRLHGLPFSEPAQGHRTSNFQSRLVAQLAITTLACVAIYGAASSTLVVCCGGGAVRLVPVIWTLAAIAAIPVVHAFRAQLTRLVEFGVVTDRYRSLRMTTIPVEATMYAVFGLFAGLQLLVFTTPLRIAGCLALFGLLTAAVFRKRPVERIATTAIMNWTVLSACVQWQVPQSQHVLDWLRIDVGLAPWFVAVTAAASLLPWMRYIRRVPVQGDDLAAFQRLGLRIAMIGALAITLPAGSIHSLAVLLAIGAFSVLIGTELWIACRKSDETRVWNAEMIAALAVGYFLWFHVITIGRGISMFATLGVGVVLYVTGLLAQRRLSTAILAKPFVNTGLWMPLVAVGIGVCRHIVRGDQIAWHGLNSLAILLAGGFYFWRAVEHRSKPFAVLSAAILNIALALLWRELQLNDPQFYMIPIGISILALIEILKREIPTAWHDPLRYAGALTILVSPTFHIVSGSWLHLFTLMLASTGVLLVSIGLRVRALMYAGAGFLIADLVGMVVCGGADHPNLLWIAGIGFGAAILMLGAVCEHNRERVLQRMRALSTQLEQWS